MTLARCGLSFRRNVFDWESVSVDRDELAKTSDDLPVLTKAIWGWVGNPEEIVLIFYEELSDARIHASYSEVRIEGKMPLFESLERLN